MDTGEIMELSLKLASMEKIPEDSAIYVSGKKITKVLFGIDAGIPELLLAKQLGCDGVIAHHPQGDKAVTEFYEVFKRHVQQMHAAGIPKIAAEAAVERKLEILKVQAHTRNYGAAVDVAKILRMPYMNIHTPLDEVGRQIMSRKIRSRISEKSKVKAVVSALEELPEFRNAYTRITVRLGEDESPAGKVVVSHGAGTNGGYDVARTYFKHGVKTVVYIHVDPEDLRKLRNEDSGNLIVTGHIASDSVGINPLVHELKRRGISVTTVGIVQDN